MLVLGLYLVSDMPLKRMINNHRHTSNMIMVPQRVAVQKVLGSIPGQASFFVELSSSPCVCVGSLRPPLIDKDMHVRIPGNSKITQSTLISLCLPSA